MTAIELANLLESLSARNAEIARLAGAGARLCAEIATLATHTGNEIVKALEKLVDDAKAAKDGGD